MCSLVHRGISYCIIAVLLLIALVSNTWCATQSIGGVEEDGELRVSVYDDGRIGIQRYDMSSSTWVDQVFNNSSKGSLFWHDTKSYQLGYYIATNMCSMVSNSKSNDGNTITLVTSSYDGSFTFKLIVTYIPKTTFIDYTFLVTNTSGSDFSDVRFFHGNDSYFSGNDLAPGFWDASSNTVGAVRTTDGMTTFMGLQSFIETYAYDSLDFSLLMTNVSNGALTNTVDENEITDNAYALEWRTDSLAAGASWTITARESIGTAATVETKEATDIGSGEATFNGEVTSAGSGTVSSRGFCWNTSGSPDLSDEHTSVGSGTGSFSTTVKTLLGNQHYYIRAYATNNVGTTYGDSVEITTTPPTSATVSKATSSTVTSRSVKLNGNVTSSGGSIVTECGFCWNTIGDPKISDTYTAASSGVGIFTISLTTLTPGKTYYIRTYAINDDGISYGTVTVITVPVAGSLSGALSVPLPLSAFLALCLLLLATGCAALKNSLNYKR